MPYSQEQEITPDSPHSPLLLNASYNWFAGGDTCNESQAIACEGAHLVVSFHENTRLFFVVL